MGITIPMGLNYNGLGSLWDEKFKKQQLQKLLIMQWLGFERWLRGNAPLRFSFNSFAESWLRPNSHCQLWSLLAFLQVQHVAVDGQTVPAWKLTTSRHAHNMETLYAILGLFCWLSFSLAILPDADTSILAGYSTPLLTGLNPLLVKFQLLLQSFGRKNA
jgi:hypothetical protein